MLSKDEYNEQSENEQIWSCLDEVRSTLFRIAKILGARSKDEKELRQLHDLSSDLVDINYLMGRRKRRDPRGRIRRVVRDENGRIEGLEDVEYSYE